MDSLKALDPNRPIREADIFCGDLHVRFVPEADIARRYSITSSARNTIDGGTVRAGALAVLAFSAVIVSIGKFP